MTSVQIALFAFAVTLVGLSKGGLAGISMLGTPALAMVMPPPEAAALLLPVLMVQDAYSLWLYRGQWDPPNLVLLLPPAVVGIGVGIASFAALPESDLMLMLGIVTTIFGVRQLMLLKAPAHMPSRWMGRLLGFVSGFTSTLIHVGGPPFQMYLMPQRLPRDIFVGTSVVFFAVVNATKLPGFIFLGEFSGRGLVVALLATPLALVSTRLGVFLVRRIPVERFYLIISVLLIGVGLKLIWDGVV